MFEFYDGPLNPVHSISASEHLSAMEALFSTEGHWFREVAQAMQSSVTGRRVLEVACGHGRWSIFAADTAAQVVATDNSPRLLAAAKQIADCKSVLEERLQFLEADAFELDAVPGKYNGAVVMNFFQHISMASHSDFLDGLHRKLLPGAVVFMGANHFSTESLQSKPGAPDTYEVRSRPDGSTYEIIDNVLSHDMLRNILSNRAVDLKFETNDAWWWLTYTVTEQDT